MVATDSLSLTIARRRSEESVEPVPERVIAARSFADRSALRRGVGLSLAVHVLAVLGLLLAHPVPPPEPMLAAFKLVAMPAEPDRAPTGPPPSGAVPPSLAPPDRDSIPLANSSSVPSPPSQEMAATELPRAPMPAIAEAPPERSAVPVTPKQSPAVSPPSRRRVPKPRSPSPSPAESPPTDQASPSLAPMTGTPGPSAPPTEASESTAAAVLPTAPVPHADAAQLSPAWLASVAEWLKAHRTYPQMARRLGREGTVVVRFTIDRGGHVLDVGLVRGSGSEMLDQAAQALLRDASLPPFPPDMLLPQQSVILPIHYRLE